jgi:hypothetical protein
MSSFLSEHCTYGEIEVRRTAAAQSAVPVERVNLEVRGVAAGDSTGPVERVKEAE